MPAAIVGLVVYVLVALLDVAAAVANDVPEMAFKGIWVKIIIVVALIKAVQAGVKASRSRQAEGY
jgi:hypothetical protein